MDGSIFASSSMGRNTRRNAWQVWAIGGFCALTLFHLGAVWSAWQPWGVSESTLILANVGFSLVAVPVALGSGAALVVAIPMSIVRQSRDAGKALAIGAAAALFIAVADVLVYRAIFNTGVRQVTARGDEIITAIRRFEGEQGRTPEELTMLVPQYLASVPSTGAAFSGDFFYSSGSQSWQLIAGLTQWVLDDTRLLHRSDNNYDDAGNCSPGYGAWMICG